MKTIIVNVTGHDTMPKVLKTAVALAERNSAHLIGLYVIHQRVAMSGLYSWGSAYSFPNTSKAELKNCAIAEAAFRDSVAYTGLDHEFRCIDKSGASPLLEVTAQARLANLFIIGAETGWYDDKSGQADVIGEIIEGSGRPVLVIPEDGPDAPTFNRATIGWDGSREASRAVFDAIPLLKSFDQVELISVTVGEADLERRRLSLARIVESLDRYGITATVQTVDGSRKSTKILAKIAKTSDLMVLGASHHTRAHELFFGSVTLGFLKSPPCAVMFSS